MLCFVVKLLQLPDCSSPWVVTMVLYQFPFKTIMSINFTSNMDENVKKLAIIVDLSLLSLN